MGQRTRDRVRGHNPVPTASSGGRPKAIPQRACRVGPSIRLPIQAGRLANSDLKLFQFGLRRCPIGGMTCSGAHRCACSESGRRRLRRNPPLLREPADDHGLLRPPQLAPPSPCHRHGRPTLALTTGRHLLSPSRPGAIPRKLSQDSLRTAGSPPRAPASRQARTRRFMDRRANANSPANSRTTTAASATSKSSCASPTGAWSPSGAWRAVSGAPSQSNSGGRNAAG